MFTFVFINKEPRLVSILFTVCLCTQGTADDDDVYSAATALKRIAALSRCVCVCVCVSGKK